ncbi:DUF2188 domain-containing protein [Curtobacterium sp. MCBD17_026]|uniref:DUF2188 domain-containing protein n=1 Tax=Curtobacterium sp. MCBD17_026 TaxID=2175621 RepID=UPI0021AD2B5A|nr:DUF2188 domain-containing protein [Curtobacterium sp. MCBD17_026]WIB72534.1 DUF2188 domain-containing protein [Curtobacterium sp. MCBD17_026]
MDVRTFDVTVEREGRWWVFAIPELGTGGQARSFAEVEYEAQGVAAAWLDVAPETVAVNVHIEPPADVRAEWEAADKDDAAAREALARAAARRRAVVLKLRKEMSAADAGAVLGISRQRVYQIESPKPPAASRNREVVPGPNGGWDVRGGDSRTVAHADTQAEAIDRARQIIKNGGGGEIHVRNQNGEIRSKDTIAPGRKIQSL